MILDVYQNLAHKLNEMPNGFSATKSGVELKILQKFFEPNEAAMALKIRPTPETAASIAERLGEPLTETKEFLDNMASKGQIACSNMSGQKM